MQKYIFTILLALLGFTFIYSNSANANTINSITERHQQCTGVCQTTYQNAVEALPCDYEATQSARSNCQSRATSVKNACLSPCTQARRDANNQCENDRKDAKKSCREDKKVETKQCRDAKKAEKKDCRDAKKEEKEICKQFSGSEKRDCKKAARQMKKECKKLARTTKKECKKTARVDKKECKAQVVIDNENCRDTAQSDYNSCIAPCDETFAASCITENRAANECQILEDPLSDTRDQCITLCNEQKDADMANHNAYCSNEHKGDLGGKVTIRNFSGETRYFYLNGVRVTNISAGATYEQGLACNTAFRLDFKRQDTESSNFVGFTDNKSYACCEEVKEDSINIPENGS